MKIGLISDTHGFLDEKIFEYFKNVDEIWHAGDIGTLEILEKLEDFKPTVAVWGNVDGNELRIRTKKVQILERENVKIVMLHIAGGISKYNAQTRELLKYHQPKLLVCGHSHILKVAFDKAFNTLYMNPGAAGKHGFHKIKTLLRFNLEKGEIKNLEAIELGKRASIH